MRKVFGGFRGSNCKKRDGGRRLPLAACDKTSLDLFWLKDDTLADLDNLPEPDVLPDRFGINGTGLLGM